MDSDYRKAKDLAAKLNKKHKFKNVFKALEFGQDCVKDADIIVCATNAYHAVVREFWLKNHCHIISKFLYLFANLCYHDIYFQFFLEETAIQAK